MATFKKEETKKGISWVGQVYLGIDSVTGKARQTTVRGKTKKEVQTKVARAKATFEGNGRTTTKVETTKSSYTFQEVYVNWLKVYAQTVKESTFQKTIKIFENHILPIFAELKIHEITVMTCQNAVYSWFNELKNFKIVNNYAGKVFHYAISIELIADNPTKKVTLPVRKETITEEDKVPNFYEKEELLHFLACLRKDAQKKHNSKWYTLFAVLSYTGMRKGEALALTWDDVDFNQQIIRVNKTLTRGLNYRLMIQAPKTVGSRRDITISDSTKEILLNWKKEQSHNNERLEFNSATAQLIFPNNKNEWMAQAKVGQTLDRLIKKYELKRITPHGFRHTHISLLFEAGASVKEVQDRVGHGDIATTMNIYTHVSKKKKESTAQRYDDYLKR